MLLSLSNVLNIDWARLCYPLHSYFVYNITTFSFCWILSVRTLVFFPSFIRQSISWHVRNSSWFWYTKWLIYSSIGFPLQLGLNLLSQKQTAHVWLFLVLVCVVCFAILPSWGWCHTFSSSLRILSFKRSLVWIFPLKLPHQVSPHHSLFPAVPQITLF